MITFVLYSYGIFNSDILNLIICFSQHLNTEGAQQQSVSLACQLLSGSVANSFQLAGMEDHAQIIGTFNSWFDVMNR